MNRVVEESVLEDLREKSERKRLDFGGGMGEGD